jgi:hypothetical protein
MALHTDSTGPDINLMPTVARQLIWWNEVGQAQKGVGGDGGYWEWMSIQKRHQQPRVPKKGTGWVALHSLFFQEMSEIQSFMLNNLIFKYNL